MIGRIDLTGTRFYCGIAMATPLIMPKQGQSVESCVILGWKKHPGDSIKAGEVVCEVETDKATFEVESPASGTLLAVFFEAGADVPVLTPIAAIGAPGENVDGLRPSGAAATTAASPAIEDRNAAYPTHRPAERSQWERIVLAPDVELHIRRPLSRSQNRKIEALIQHARETLKEE